jgi:CO/xanthine dehydrogenase Mo-binding subunit
MADVVCVEDEYKYSAFGAKGVGEIAFIATPLAIVNAIYNATGIRFYEIPLEAEKIYFAIKGRRSNGSRT